MAVAIPAKEKYTSSIIVSVLLHVVILAVLAVNFEFTSSRPVIPANIIDAVVVDSGVLEETPSKQAEKAAAEKRRQEEQRQAELRKQEELRQQEVKRQAQIAEQQRLEAEARKKAETERVTQLEIQKQKEEAARKAQQERLAEEQRVREQQQRAEWERLKAEEAAAAAAQARSNELANKKALYVEAIRQKVNRNWIVPPLAQNGYSCKVVVQQIPGGEVVSVRLESCTGDEEFRRSVEAAVYAASPLPNPPEPSLFDRVINFTIRTESIGEGLKREL